MVIYGKVGFFPRHWMMYIHGQLFAMLREILFKQG